MTDPKKDLDQLQVIQLEIAREIDKHLQNPESTELIQNLKMAFKYLNDAKVNILDMALADGSLKRANPE